MRRRGSRQLLGTERIDAHPAVDHERVPVHEGRVIRLARKYATPATSRGVPSRPAGI